MYLNTGCPICGEKSRRFNRLKIKTQQQFEQLASETHNNKYDYSHSKFEKYKQHIKIRCDVHGYFTQLAIDHLNGSGCIKCRDDNRRLTLDQFVARATKIHNNKFTYSQVKYVNIKTKVDIVCKVHGVFNQMPYNHLSGQGCPSCRQRNSSKKCKAWLNQISSLNNITIQHADNGGEYLIPGSRYKADGFCNQSNTIYEFYGDKFHGNPEVFSDKEHCHPFDPSVTAGQLLQKTKERERFIIQHGYNLITIWENDFEELQL